MIAEVFRAWQEAGIDWLILRNYENLPETTTNDIDVLLSPRQLYQAEKVLLRIAGDSGFRLANRVEFATLAFYFFHPGSGAQVHFDLFTALKWRSFDFLNCERFLEKKVNRGLFAVPHPAHEAVTSLLATMIYTGNIKEKYKPLIANGFCEHGLEVEQLLTQTYGRSLANFLVNSGAAESWAEIES